MCYEKPTIELFSVVDWLYNRRQETVYKGFGDCMSPRKQKKEKDGKKNEFKICYSKHEGNFR